MDDINLILQLSGMPTSEMEERINSTLTKCAATLNYEHSLPTILYDLRGRTAGQALLQRNTIRLNIDLLYSSTDEMINNTLIHEFAHIVAYKLYKDNGHGSAWKFVMISLGLTPDRCHTMQTTPARRTKKYHYECDCGTGLIGATRRNKILTGGTKYVCKVCNGTIRLID